MLDYMECHEPAMGPQIVQHYTEYESSTGVRKVHLYVRHDRSYAHQSEAWADVWDPWTSKWNRTVSLLPQTVEDLYHTKAMMEGLVAEILG